MTKFDTDGDNQLSFNELQTQFTSWVEELTRMVTVPCAVNLDGQPLDGATIRFIPVEFLADGTLPAVGITNPGGSTRIGIDAQDLPGDFRGVKGVQLGLYRVEITHPNVTIPAEYNTESTLGCHVTRQSANSPAVFNLKSR